MRAVYAFRFHYREIVCLLMFLKFLSFSTLTYSLTIHDTTRRTNERRNTELYFLEAAAFFAAGLDFGADAAFLGFGAFGFLVGGLAVFFALGAAAEPLLFDAAEAEAADGFFAAAGFFLAAAAFLSFVAADGFAAAADVFAGEEAAAFFPLPPAPAEAADVAFFDDAEAAPPAVDLAEEDAFLLPAPPAPAPDLAPAIDGFFEAADFDSSLKEPEAPVPFVCIRAPVSTALFRYFLMNGANFSASTL